MILRTPLVDDLCFAPELGVLAALEATLAATVQVLLAAHPELSSTDVPQEYLTVDVLIAQGLSHQATQLMATINRYRLAVFDPDS